jgi:hypothetical protein
MHGGGLDVFGESAGLLSHPFMKGLQQPRGWVLVQSLTQVLRKYSASTAAGLLSTSPSAVSHVRTAGLKAE